MLHWLASLAPLLIAVSGQPQAHEDGGELARSLRQAEVAFAKSMADRDHAAFSAFLAEEAIFFTGDGTPLRGKAAVAEAWRPFFEGSEAPFSWEPKEVEVLDSGSLGLSSGPVRDRTGKPAGAYNSVWRREADGKWRVVFDKSCPRCQCP